MKKYSFLFILIWFGCGTQPTPISVSGPSFVSAIVIYPLGDETVSLQSITKAALEAIPDFRNFDTPPDSITIDGYQVTFNNSTDSTFIPPQAILVAPEFAHLEEDEIELLQKATRSTQILLFGNSDNVAQKQQAINKFIGIITANKKVAIADYAAYIVYNPANWTTSRVTDAPVDFPTVIREVNFHVYREDEYCRIVSMGMSKFALPEISVSGVPCSNQESFGLLMDGLAQTLLETRTILSDSTVALDFNEIRNTNMLWLLTSSDNGDSNNPVKHKSVIHLRSIKPQEGDNLYRQLEVVFNDKSFSSPQEEHLKTLDDLFGSGNDEVTSGEHDEELLAASGRARAELPKLKILFNQGLAPGETLLVKSPFPFNDDGSNEWMWVEVTKWTDSEMEGVLQNDPENVEGIVAGSVVKIKESEIFDYILSKADGAMEGNETGKILEQRMTDH